jgi:hypothetical protein
MGGHKGNKFAAMVRVLTHHLTESIVYQTDIIPVREDTNRGEE